jgi:hypothetical protein
MNKTASASIIGLLSICVAGCHQGPTLDEQAPWVRRDREASLDWALRQWEQSESERLGNLQELNQDIEARWEKSVMDFYHIPVTAYTMFY